MFKLLADSGINPDNLTLRFVNSYGREIPYYDDGMGIIWVAINTSGPDRFIRASSMSDAYYIWRDESPTIDPEELYLAYGFDSQEEFEARRTAIQNAQANGEEFEEMELVEGYEYQSNFTGTGIVAIDLNGEELIPVTLEWLDFYEITLELTAKKHWRDR